MNEQELEKEIVAKGLTAPRITSERIESRIRYEYYFQWNDIRQITTPTLGLECLTLCVLVLQNGFTVTGESTCASPENFDAEIGRKIARQKAVEKVWALEGYLLKEHLYAPAG